MYLLSFLNTLVIQVNLMEDIQGKLAEELVQKCPTGVFDIEDVGSGTLCFQNSRSLLPAVTLSSNI